MSEQYADSEYIEAIRQTGITPAQLAGFMGQMLMRLKVENVKAQALQLQAERSKIVEETNLTFAERVSPIDAKLLELQVALAKIEQDAAVVIAPSPAANSLTEASG